ncbi:fibropellin-1-like isoform X2 [Anneissia japonica]|nr:fibropellin-1-like isoform X2 [Anneissia japonica]
MGEVYANDDDFTFPVGAGAAGGIDNPYIFTMMTFTNGIRIKGIVHDNDHGRDDKIDEYKQNISFTPARTSSQSNWTSVTITGRRSSLDIQVRGYCTTYYYGNTCNVFCRARDDTTGHYSCSSSGGKICLSGWQGTSCNQDVNECLFSPCENETDECLNELCENGGVCTDYFNNFTCKCQPGFQGEFCEIDFNECSSDPCANYGNCSDSVNAFHCACAPGYTGSTCNVNIDECQSLPCQNSGTCTDVIDGYSCNCTAGFTGDYCQTDIDECLSGPCQNNATCVDEVATFTCTCQSGYVGNSCDINYNECQSEPCFNGATCQDEVNKYSCICPPGFDGTTCSENVDECQSLPCINNGTCSDKIDSFACLCEDGYTGTICSENVDECQSSPCQNNGTCDDGVNGFHCQCSIGFEGKLCHVDIDECESSPCVNDATCIDLVATFICTCAEGFTGAHCEVNINECDSSPCKNQATCVDDLDMYTCICPSGFTGDLCENDLDECVSNPCKYGACVDLPGQFECNCSDFYVGKTCEFLIDDVCSKRPCENGKCRLVAVDEFECLCDTGFYGSFCSIDLSKHQHFINVIGPLEDKNRFETGMNALFGGSQMKRSSTVQTKIITTDEYEDVLTKQRVTHVTFIVTLSDKLLLSREVENLLDSYSDEDISLAINQKVHNGKAEPVSQTNDGNSLFSQWYVLLVVGVILILIVLSVTYLRVRRFKYHRDCNNDGTMNVVNPVFDDELKREENDFYGIPPLQEVNTVSQPGTIF